MIICYRANTLYNLQIYYFMVYFLPFDPSGRLYFPKMLQQCSVPPSDLKEVVSVPSPGWQAVEHGGTQKMPVMCAGSQMLAQN